MTVHGSRRACLILGALLCSAGAGLAEAGSLQDRFYGGTADRPAQRAPVQPGAGDSPLLAQAGPGSSGGIPAYGLSDSRLAGGASASSANPAIAAVLNGYYADFSRPGELRVPGFALGPDADAGKPGFQLQDTDLDVYGNIDPYLYGFLVLTFSGAGGVSVEEAFIQTTTLPFGLILKAGRYHSSIGYLNVFHRHADDFIDPPLVYQAFLNGQLADDGLTLRWVAPTDVLLELGTELLNGQNWPAAGSTSQGKGTATQFVKLADDLGESASYLLGLSHVDSAATDRRSGGNDAASHAHGLSFTGTNSLNIVSFVYKWSPLGNMKYSNFKFQAEVFQGDEHGVYTVLDTTGAPSTTAIDLRGSQGANRSGWYAQAAYKFWERWRVGLRQSEVNSARLKDPAAAGTDLDSTGPLPSISSAMVEYWPSDFSQFRFQYSNDQTIPGRPTDRFYVQYLIALGAHGAHSY